MKNISRIVITGANGFIGSKLAEALPENKVVCLDRKKHSLFEIDSLVDLIKNAEIIYHLAGSTSGSGHDTGDAILVKNNIEATYNLLIAISKFCKKPPLLINMSTIHVYEKTSKKIKESSTLGPDSPYGFSKLAQEFLIAQAANSKLIRSVIFRASNIYGPGDLPHYNSAIATFCDLIKNKHEIKLFARGKATIDLIYIDDVVDILLNVLTIEKHGGQIYNIASGVTLSIEQVVNVLEEVTGIKIKRKLVDSGKSHFSINIDKIREAYPSFQLSSVHQGLKITYEKI